MRDRIFIGQQEPLRAGLMSAPGWDTGYNGADETLMEGWCARAACISPGRHCHFCRK